MEKNQWLSYFRDKSNKEFVNIQEKAGDYKEQASRVNAVIGAAKEEAISKILQEAETNQWGNDDILDAVLMITYTADVVMLESRNRVWPYEYMTFTRRIGELWEPFCKEAFRYSIRPLKTIEPPVFEKIQNKLVKKTEKYISRLNVEDTVKRELLYYYKIPWTIVKSGGIKLELDLHFKQSGNHYNCDFKSGFSSNEKGNTNRLLMVASIYRLISSKEKMILFVRQKEEDNNHYLQTLKNSGYWKIYCADNAYRKIMKFTGFDLRKWLDENVLWEQDISEEFRKHLIKNDLLKYLTW